MRLFKPIFTALIGVMISSGFVEPAEAQYTQQGTKLVGTGAAGAAFQGQAVAISADGNTAIVGGPRDSGNAGAAWIYTRTNGVWSQQGNKLVGTGAVGVVGQGEAVAISADGNTAALGAGADNGNTGAVWIFTRTNGVWSQQGSKLTGTGFVGNARLGDAVALSGDGNTAMAGGPDDNNFFGAVWVFTRTNGVWSQSGGKLAGTGALGSEIDFGQAVAMSTDGNTAIVGGSTDNNAIGAVWIFIRSSAAQGPPWVQQGGKLVGTGAIGPTVEQGVGVAISADGNTVESGATYENGGLGATWIFTRSNGVWSQQGGKLVGTGYVGGSKQGGGAALSADGNTALIGGVLDNQSAGAFWVFTRANGVWTQQGGKIVGMGAVGTKVYQGVVAMSGDGKTVVSGGLGDNANVGAAWVFAAPAPVSVSVSPPAGSGATGTFTFTFSDVGGWQNLTVVDVLIRNVLDGRQACYVAFVPSSANAGAVDLVDDQGDAGGPYSYMLLPGSGSVSNSQCSITAAGSSAAGSGNTLTVTLPITFAPGFAGNKAVYLSAQDASSTSGWQALGTWGVTGAISSPAVSVVAPAHSGGGGQTYTFTFTDGNGWQDLTLVDVLINTAIDGGGACYVAFAPMGAGSGAIYLVDNAGDAGGPYAGMVLPSASTVSNEQCSIAGVGSAVTAGGNTLTLTLAIAFGDSFGSNRVVYVAAKSATQNSGWQAMGTVGEQ